MNAIIAGPCSFSCLTDSILRRIARSLNGSAIDRIKDKKDKIKSKLFLMKIIQLFEMEYTSDECPANAAFLFQCAWCYRLLTQITAKCVSCLPWRRVVTQEGNLVPVHQPLPTQSNLAYERLWPTSVCEPVNMPQANCATEFNIHYDNISFTNGSLTRTPSGLSSSFPSRLNEVRTGSVHPSSSLESNRIFCATDLLVSWYLELKSWRLVYWRLWATINLQTCNRCGRQFPIIELGDGCIFHPEKPLPRNLVGSQMGDATKCNETMKPTYNVGEVSKLSLLHSSALNRYPEEGATCLPDESRSPSECRNLKSQLVYPCCGLEAFHFEPFRVPSGCYRNHHILDAVSSSSDSVARLAQIHRDLFLSWAPKRTFNPKNSPGLASVGGFKLQSPDTFVIQSQLPLCASAPAFTLLDCMDRSSNIQQEVYRASCLGDQQLPSAHHTMSSDRTSQASQEQKGAVLVKKVATRGILSSTPADRCWNSMKVCRINQDNQRQEDLRRMTRIGDFLYAHRESNFVTGSKTIPKKVSGGIYCRLESQWLCDFGANGVARQHTQPLLRKTKPTRSTCHSGDSHPLRQ
ncbi:unnamed protein product [Dicrocoelium dendriticum]|nr:unnamed protein product [Dicrocoelium dendriticum]